MATFESCLESVWDEWHNCEQCGLSEERKSVVLGRGPQDASIMLVGEAPEEQEDEEGLAFVGAGGDLLNDLLGQANLDREKMFLTNTVCCRPPGNRDPFDPERAACWPRLQQQIYCVDPDIIIVAGNIAAKTLLGARTFYITQERGVMRTVMLDGMDTTYPVAVMPILHPAYLLRNPGYKKHGPLYRTYKDLELVRKAAQLLERTRA
jgi:uracil-DNA glycosylase